MAWQFGPHLFARGAAEVSPKTESLPPLLRVHALGRLEPRGTVLQISAPSGNDGARVEELLVAEGDDVRVGDVLATLDTFSRRQTTVAEAEAQLRIEQARLELVKAGAKPGDIDAQTALVERFDVELAAAQRELNRARQLSTREFLSAESLEIKELAKASIELERKRAIAQLASLREVREVDVQLQQRQVDSAAAAVARAQADFEATQVRTRVAGRILRIHTHPGERIADQGVLQLGDVAHMQAVAEVFEGDVQHVRLGQSAKILLDSSRQELRGTVVQLGRMVARKDVLSNDPVSDTDARVLEVRIDLHPEDIPAVESLSNARVQVSIDISSASSRSQ